MHPPFSLLLSQTHQGPSSISLKTSVPKATDDPDSNAEAFFLIPSILFMATG